MLNQAITPLTSTILILIPNPNTKFKSLIIRLNLCCSSNPNPINWVLRIMILSFQKLSKINNPLPYRNYCFFYKDTKTSLLYLLISESIYRNNIPSHTSYEIILRDIRKWNLSTNHKCIAKRLVIVFIQSCLFHNIVSHVCS